MAQRASQEKDKQGGGEDRGDGKKKGGPGAEEHPAGGGAEVAGDGGQHHRQELEQELHRKIKLKEGSGKEQSHLDETEGVSEPTLMIGEKTEEEADEPTRMFTGDIGDFIKKKREYEDVPEEDAYEEILQSWERKR